MTAPPLPGRGAVRRGAARHTGSVPGAARISRRTLLLGAPLAVLAGCTASREGQRVVIATGGTKGVYYSYGLAMADAIEPSLDGARLSVESTLGSVDNLRQIARGQARMAIVAADAAADAVAGRSEFEVAVPIRALARLYDDVIHLVTRADSGIRSIRDLIGHRVSLGPSGSGTELIARRMLEVAGVTLADDDLVPLGINESVASLADGDIDAFWWSGGVPTVGVTELVSDTDIRMIDLGELSSGLRAAYGLSYRWAMVPAGTYGIPEDISTIAVPNVLVADAAMDAGLVFDITAGLFAERARMARRVAAVGALDLGEAIYTAPIELHPGALRFYRQNRG